MHNATQSRSWARTTVTVLLALAFLLTASACGSKEYSEDLGSDGVTSKRRDASSKRYKARGRVIKVQEVATGNSTSVFVVLHTEAVPEFLDANLKKFGLPAGEHRFRVGLGKRAALTLNKGDIIEIGFYALWPKDGKNRMLMLERFGPLPPDTRLDL